MIPSGVRGKLTGQAHSLGIGQAQAAATGAIEGPE